MPKRRHGLARLELPVPTHTHTHTPRILIVLQRLELLSGSQLNRGALVNFMFRHCSDKKSRFMGEVSICLRLIFLRNTLPVFFLFLLFELLARSPKFLLISVILDLLINVLRTNWKEHKNRVRT